MDFIVKMAIGCVAGFAITLILLHFLPGEKILLGHDRGRKFAQGAEVNIGKPTGVGFYFILVFLIVTSVICFIVEPLSSGKGLFESGNAVSGLGFGLLAILAEMVTGWLDDRSKKPWNEYIKGGLDVVVSLIAAFICVHFFGTRVYIAITGTYFDIHPVLFYILTVILFIVSINATNATDGIDGLSGTLSLLAVFTTFLMGFMAGSLVDANSILVTIVFVPAILAYLIYNFNPSKMLMGDAGSRGLGFFIAFFLIYCRIPLLYFIVGLPFLCDGGISIVKITVGRLTKKKVILFKNITTPLHDELRKNRKFSVKRVWLVLVLAAGMIDFLYVFTATLLRILGVVG
jgi:phospho-N-acetylmuramoyl-pentapeptide-transferase